MADPKNASHRVSIKCAFIANHKVLTMHLIDKHWTLVGGGVDEWEDIIAAMKREFWEETWCVRKESFQPELIHAEIHQYPQKWQFSAVVNLFYKIDVDQEFPVHPEPGVYEAYCRCSKEELIKLSGKFNKEVVLTYM